MSIGIQTDDLLTRILDLINSGSTDEAVKTIVELELSQGLDLMRKLVTNILEYIIDSQDRDRAHALARALARARARALALDLALNLALALDLDLARDLARALDRALDRDRDLALDLARARARALDLALDLDLALASYFSDINANIGIDNPAKIAALIVSVLEVWCDAYTPRNVEASQDINKSQGGVISTMIFDGLDRLTPENLSSQVAPYLQAIFDIQQIVGEFEVQAGGVAAQPRIVSISQNSPIQVSVEGIGKAFDIISMMVIPWKRENAKKRDDSAVAQEQLKIVVAQAEIAEKKLQSAQNQKMAALELEQKRLEIREKQLDLDKREREGFEETLRMAFRILDEVAPGLSAEQRVARAIDLTRGVKVIAESRLEIRAGFLS